VRQLGHFVTKANLSLIDEATQFLGGLKIAISQNLQNNFVREFEAMLGNVGTRQIRYVREQTMTGLTISAVLLVSWPSYWELPFSTFPRPC